MEIEGKDVTILGGTGLVGAAVVRRIAACDPARLVVAGLKEAEVREVLDELRQRPEAAGVAMEGEWGDLFLRDEHQGRSRQDLLSSREGRTQLLEDVFDPPGEELYRRSALCSLLERRAPDVLVDCVNTATAIAYQDLFTSAKALRRKLDSSGPGPDPAAVEAHLSSLYLPQLIRHVQLLLEGMRRAGTRVYVKVGTSGTGGMGLNIPFTHSEERPSPTLLAKAGLAGAHTHLLFLMGRTPGAPAVKEVKPAAAIAWREIGFGPVRWGDEPLQRFDAARALDLDEAFGPDAGDGYRDTGEIVKSVYLDAGENGLFSLSEFETISSLRMMEIVTPEEIADTVVSEIRGRPTGRDTVAALDGAVYGPTYRGGVLREAALRRMEELEEQYGVRSVAFEMLGPPRLSKLLFEAAILERLYLDLEAAAGLDPEETAEQAVALLDEDPRLRSDALSVGLPILLPDGGRLLRGPEVKVRPEDGDVLEALEVDRLARRGWIDLRAETWERWRERCRGFLADRVGEDGPDRGSGADLDVRARSGDIRPGALAAYVLGVEDGGERDKR